MREKTKHTSHPYVRFRFSFHFAASQIKIDYIKRICTASPNFELENVNCRIQSCTGRAHKISSHAYNRFVMSTNTEQWISRTHSWDGCHCSLHVKRKITGHPSKIQKQERWLLKSRLTLKLISNKTWTAGFEPARAKPTWFLVMPDNHSGTSTSRFTAPLKQHFTWSENNQ